jgi:hypothetical protein
MSAAPLTQSVPIPRPLISQMATMAPQMDFTAMRPLFKKWYFDPVAFVHQALHVQFIEKWQEDVLRDIAVHNRVAVRSGHGVGKSAGQCVGSGFLPKTTGMHSWFRDHELDISYSRDGHHKRSA